MINDDSYSACHASKKSFFQEKTDNIPSRKIIKVKINNTTSLLDKKEKCYSNLQKCNFISERIHKGQLLQRQHWVRKSGRPREADNRAPEGGQKGGR